MNFSQAKLLRDTKLLQKTKHIEWIFIGDFRDANQALWQAFVSGGRARISHCYVECSNRSRGARRLAERNEAWASRSV